VSVCVCVCVSVCVCVCVCVCTCRGVGNLFIIQGWKAGMPWYVVYM
jgi:hypothetical protein